MIQANPFAVDEPEQVDEAAHVLGAITRRINIPPDKAAMVRGMEASDGPRQANEAVQDIENGRRSTSSSEGDG